MLTGTITSLQPAQRIGFLKPVFGGVPILFPALAVEGVYFADLVEGQTVTYILQRDPQGRGARALHVRPLDCPPASVADDE
jgi:cold shock CspA family protein